MRPGSRSGVVAVVRRVGVLPLLAASLAVAAAVDFLVEFPGALDQTDSSIRVQKATAVSDRRLAAAFNYDVSRAFIVEAQQLLPRHARYAFLTGPHSSASMPVTVTAAPFVSHYLLMPRRLVRVADASWLLCYGCELGHVARHPKIVWREPDAPGLVIARLGA